MIWSPVSSDICWATSASRMVDSALVKFSSAMRRLFKLLSNAFFWKAPKSALKVEICSTAASTILLASCAPWKVVTSISERLWKPLLFSIPCPSIWAFTFFKDNRSLCPAFGPSWNSFENCATWTYPSGPPPTTSSLVSSMNSVPTWTPRWSSTGTSFRPISRS